MKENVECGICKLKQGNGVQIIYPIVTVENGNTLWRCSSHLNWPVKDGEGEQWV